MKLKCGVRIDVILIIRRVIDLEKRKIGIKVKLTFEVLNSLLDILSPMLCSSNVELLLELAVLRSKTAVDDADLWLRFQVAFPSISVESDGKLDATNKRRLSLRAALSTITLGFTISSPS